MTIVPHGRFATNVINNPRWRMEFAIRHTVSTVNDKGRSEKTVTEEQATGNIQPASGEMLEQLPEGDRVGESISIKTPAILTDGNDAQQADIVVWHGREYLVKSVKDWRDYGFCHAIAFLMGVRGKNA